MAERKYKTHGIYSLTNCIGIAVSIIDDEHVAYQLRTIDGEKSEKWHRVKIYYTPSGSCYFKCGKMRIYLDEVMRV